MSKLPTEIRLIVRRELNEEKWEVGKMMEIIEREIEARERSMPATIPNQKVVPTAAALMVSNLKHANCAYCECGHPSASCTVVISVEAKREALRKSGRCYVCLRKNHISRNCRSASKCTTCQGRHHRSICLQTSPRGNVSLPATTPKDINHQSGNSANTLCANAKTPVYFSKLLNCSFTILMNPSDPC